MEPEKRVIAARPAIICGSAGHAFVCEPAAAQKTPERRRCCAAHEGPVNAAQNLAVRERVLTIGRWRRIKRAALGHVMRALAPGLIHSVTQ